MNFPGLKSGILAILTPKWPEIEISAILHPAKWVLKIVKKGVFGTFKKVTFCF